MVRRSLSIAAVSLLGIAFLSSPARGVDVKVLDDIRAQARQAEKDHKWGEACSYYAFLLSKDRHNGDDREHFQTCLRHLHRTRRHQDTSYRQQVLEQDAPIALKVYGEVLNQLQAYPEGERVELNRLFHQGIHEFRLALSDDAFQKMYLPAASKVSIGNFLALLSREYAGKHVRSIGDAKKYALRIAFQAREDLGIKPTVTVLEFACGACNALDEHTYYMTPRQYGEDLASLRGDTVGVGIELALVDRKLVIGQVVINSPAARANLRGDEEIVRINRTRADRLTIDSAHEMLKGKLGSTVEIEVVTTDKQNRVVTLIRQPVNASVTFYRMLDPTQGIAYISLVAFNQNTLQELDEAIRTLDLQGMKVLILDLRGNPGGLSETAGDVAERFLWEGAYIVSTKGKVSEVKRVSRNANPLTVPLVVLVDGGTASAGEILAGALKENIGVDMQPRAKLVGMPTFGKGTTQHMVELKTVQAGGIRITWAKLFSPRNNPYNGTGVEPHQKVEGADNQITEAVNAARELLGRSITMMR